MGLASDPCDGIDRFGTSSSLIGASASVVIVFQARACLPITSCQYCLCSHPASNHRGSNVNQGRRTKYGLHTFFRIRAAISWAGQSLFFSPCLTIIRPRLHAFPNRSVVKIVNCTRQHIVSFPELTPPRLAEWDWKEGYVYNCKNVPRADRWQWRYNYITPRQPLSRSRVTQAGYGSSEHLPNPSTRQNTPTCSSMSSVSAQAS